MFQTAVFLQVFLFLQSFGGLTVTAEMVLSSRPCQPLFTEPQGTGTTVAEAHSRPLYLGPATLEVLAEFQSITVFQRVGGTPRKVLCLSQLHPSWCTELCHCDLGPHLKRKVTGKGKTHGALCSHGVPYPQGVCSHSY